MGGRGCEIPLSCAMDASILSMNLQSRIFRLA
jgi:hypothetical protein